MQQLETSKQIVEAEHKYKRECKGRSLALTRNVYRLVNTDIFYVESESSNNTYYFVKFKPDVIEFCSCMDNTTRRGLTCKHIHAIVFAIKLGTLKDTEKLPKEAKRKHVVVAEATTAAIAESSYRDDNYSF
jgi:predicted nucleic acid-binding Zn finger protein